MFCACNGSNQSEVSTKDTMPVIKPEVNDTSGVVTPPPTGDSNVIHPDTSVKSK